MIAARWLVGVALLAAALPGYAAAQSGGARQDLQLERKEKKAVVQPVPDAARAEKDVDEATRTIERGRIIGDVERKVTRPPTPPDVDETVSGAIQSESLRKAKP